MRRGGTLLACLAALASAGTGLAVTAAHEPHRASRESALTHPHAPARASWLVGRGGPIRFAPGACVAFAPAGTWNGRTVSLDPGHGGVDPGTPAAAGGRGAAEKGATLAVALRARDMLRGSGYRVVLSRVRDSTVARLSARDMRGGVMTPGAAARDIDARNMCANAAHADVLVALHMDGFSDATVAGSETIYSPARPFAARSRRLAALVQRSVLARLRRTGVTTADRGVLTDSSGVGGALTPAAAHYHHLIELGPAKPPWRRHPSRMPGVLAEPLFLSNPSEAAFAFGRGRIELGGAIADAIRRYFRVEAGR